MAAHAPVPGPREIRLIHLALGLGVMLFLAVALVVRSGEPGRASSLHLVLLGTGLATLVAALVLRARVSGRNAAQPAVEWWRDNYVSAMVVWSLIEAGSFMGIVGFWVTGNQLPLVVTAAGLVLFVLTAPARLSGE